MQGKCATPPDAASSYGLSGEALNWRAGQCLIIADHDLFFITHRLWLDSLLIRAKPSQWSSFFFLVLDSFSELYATDVTLQSDGQWNTTLVYMYDGGARAYMEGTQSRCKSDQYIGRHRYIRSTYRYIGSIWMNQPHCVEAMAADRAVCRSCLCRCRERAHEQL